LDAKIGFRVLGVRSGRAYGKHYFDLNPKPYTLNPKLIG